MLINSQVLSEPFKQRARVEWELLSKLRYQKHDSLENTFSLFKMIPCWLFSKAKRLNVSFLSKPKIWKVFFLRYKRKMKIFHISFYYFLERGGNGKKGKSHLLYTYSPTHSRLAHTKSQLISIHFRGKVLNSLGGKREAETHRYFNSKTKGVKVIFHNFPPLFIV